MIVVVSAVPVRASFAANPVGCFKQRHFVATFRETKSSRHAGQPSANYSDGGHMFTPF
jgi:hypothetical protein